METHSSCGLFSLPPELRLHIYKYVLLEGSYVQASHQIPHDPAIIRTCRLIRSEALDVCGTHYRPTFEVVDCNVTKITSWYTAAPHCRRCIYLTQRRDRPRWANLRGWLEKFFQGRVPGFKSAQDSSAWVGAVSHVFDVASGLTVAHDLYWDEAEPIIESVHHAMAVLDKKWR